MIIWIGCGALVAAYGIGRYRPLHRARHWAVSYLLELTEERAGLLKMAVSALLVPDFVVRGHRAAGQGTKGLPPAPQLSPEWQERAERARADRAHEITPDVPTEETDV